MKQKKLYVRWHSRAGQGAVTAANFFVDAMNKLGYATSGFPDYGAEKRGAPVVVYNIISSEDKVISDPAHLRHLDLVILLDPTLVGNELTYDDVLKGLSDEGILVINTSKEVPSKFNEKFKGQVFHIPATQIALDTVNRNVPNVATIGGLASILDLDTVKMKKIMKESLSSVFPEKIVTKNMEGFDRGEKEIFEVKN